MSAEDIFHFDANLVRDLHIVARAPVPLENGQSEFVIFRGGDGLRDQVAVIVGKPDTTQPVLTRLHSACLTGDLFGSLKCDCGDQLRGAVKKMTEQGGGILLYLDQEGRGHGLANKIRAYQLQGEGLDTFEADDALGFGLDRRRFEIGAEMLKQLGVSKITLLSNNPAKIAALRQAGLDVSAAPLMGRLRAENLSYLKSKRDKAQHRVDLPKRSKTGSDN